MTNRLPGIEMMGILTLWMAAVTLMVGGCATLDKDECLNADWQSIGYEDGARGYKASRIGNHRKACAKHGIAPDFDLYEKGRLRGLAEWCTPQNGYRQGAGGKLYTGVCPGPLAGPFKAAFNHGKAIHAYASQIKGQENVLRKMTVDFDAMEAELQALEDELVRPGVSPRRRRRLLEDIRELEAQQNALLNDIDDMERTLADMNDHLARLRENNPYK